VSTARMWETPRVQWMWIHMMGDGRWCVRGQVDGSDGGIGVHTVNFTVGDYSQYTDSSHCH
jgi:hypothetical protein